MKKAFILASLGMIISVVNAQEGTVHNHTHAVSSTSTLVDIPAGHWAREAVKAISETGLIQGYPDGTFRGNENLTRYQAAMIFYRLLESGKMGSLSNEKLEALALGMQEVSLELARINGRLTDVERLTVEQQARIETLESLINDLKGNNSESLMKDITALKARIAELEKSNKAIHTNTKPIKPVVVTDTTKTTTTPSKKGKTEIKITPMMAGKQEMYFGIGASYNKAGIEKAGQKCKDPIGLFDKNKKDKTSDACFGVNATVGTNHLYGPVGARVNVEFLPTLNNTVAADLNAVAALDMGAIKPYAGAGVGMINGSARVKAVDRKNDFYANVLAGAEFKVAKNIGIFAEGNGRYFFKETNTEFANQLVPHTKDKGKGFTFGAKAGVKFFF